MRVGGMYSFNGGKTTVLSRYANELEEIYQIITSVDAKKTNKKESFSDIPLYRPSALNAAFKQRFESLHWQSNIKVYCNYSTEYYLSDYVPPENLQKTYRKIDFLKNRLGIGIMFEEFSSMVYNVCAKMTIFHNENFIDVGVEIVPLKGLANEMSTGVSYFEQFVWDLERRGVADIDIPVLILGITA